MAREQLIGTWKIISCKYRRSDGEVTYPYGKQPLGQLMYDSAGNMSSIIMRPERPKFSINDKFQGTPEEIKSAFDGFDAIFGTYEVDEENESVIHHGEGSLFPNWEGMVHPRFVKLSGKRLTLSTTPILYGDGTIIGTLVWERKA